MTLDEKIKHAKILLNSVNHRYAEILQKLFHKNKEKEAEKELESLISSLVRVFEDK